MLQISHLTLTHKKDLRVILKEFNIVLNRGDKAVIIGEEGNGKSTLLKWIYDPALVSDYIEAEGERSCQGEKLGYLPQELPAEHKKLTVYEYFSAWDGFWDQTPADLKRMAARLHLPSELFYSDQKMGTLSGGEKVKLQMARLLMEQPDILLLDEPSNDIDIETLEWMEALIRESGQTVLFISHDETLIEKTANRVILLEQLRRKTVSRYTVANLPFSQFMEERAAAFDKQAQLAQSEQREERKALEKFRSIQQSVEHAQNSVSRQDPHGGRMLKKKMASVKAMGKRFEREHAERTQEPEYETSISIRFDRQRPMPAGKIVLDHEWSELRRPDDGAILARKIHLVVKGPEKICIIGKNGAGKTTLLRKIKDLLLSRADLHAGYMPQEYGELLELDRSPVEFLAPDGSKESVTKVRTLLGSMKYTADEMNHPIRELSGGQKAKVLLLRMSLQETDVLILDEPTRNFSPLSGPEIRRLLRTFPGAIVSISHDRKYIDEVCDKVYRLTENGLRLERQN